MESKSCSASGAYDMIPKPETLAFWMGRLPHWEVEDGRYFITVHLAGAIPAQGRNRLRQIAAQLRQAKDRNAPEWLQIQRAIFVEMERWLDRAEWNPHLQRRDIAEIVADAIEHRHHRGDWHIFEYVIMPTHIHLFCEIGSRGVKAVLEDFKRWTGHRAAKLIGTNDDRFWQREWFDHWSRSDEEDERTILYIRKNPERASLVKDYREWPYASWSRQLR
jgi:REP element-mobilizing transposase RayT